MNNRDAFYRNVGKMIREGRKQRKLSQATLASAIGLTRTSISNIEKGRQKFLIHTFYEIVEVLGIPPSALLPAESSPSAPDLRKIPEDLPKQERAFIEAGIRAKIRR